MFLNPSKILEQIENYHFIKVGEFGIGSGIFSEALYKKTIPQGELFLFDIRPEIIKKIYENFKEKDFLLEKIHFLSTNLENENATKLKDGLLDLIVISQTLFQSKNPENILKEAKRVTTKNGRILIIDWKESFQGIGPQKENLVKEEKVKKIAQKLDLKLDRKLDAGKFHYALLFKK